MATATIKFSRSETGRKASILAGGDGKAEGVITVERDDPNFAAVVRLGTVTDSGVILDRTGWNCPRWDSDPTTASQVVSQLEAEQAEAEREATEKAATVRAELLAVLSERKTRVTRTEVTVCNGGLTGRAHYESHAPAWSYPPQEIVESPEAIAWLAELDAANVAAKVAADVQAQADLATKVAAREEARVKEQSRREALGLEDGDLDLSIEDGALTEVPPGCWQTHSRGKNWLARISVNPASPGGLDRTFAPKAKGDSYYLLPDFAPGDAIEFGADYYSGRGRKSPTRWYGFVVRQTAEMLVVRACSTGKAAVKAGEKYAKAHRPEPTEVDTAIARVNGEGAIE